MVEQISNDESLRRLREFLYDLMVVLSENHLIAVPVRHHVKMKAAWTDVQPMFSALIKKLEVKQSDEKKNLIKELGDVGLMGNQLDFKLSIFKQAYDEFLDYPSPWSSSPSHIGGGTRKLSFVRRVRRWLGLFKRVFKFDDAIRWRRWSGLFKRALKVANVILGSLAKVLPGAEVIMEYKESVESGAELGRAATEI
jgi:hypothetical protein